MEPNVLWIFCEDLSPWLPLWGDRTVETPEIDALAQDGVAFTRAFSPAPVCSPARSGIITGCYPTSIGVHNHVSSRPGMPPVELPRPVEPLPVRMRKAGYHTYNLGKDDYNFAYDREELYAGPHQVLRYWGEHDTRNFNVVDARRDWHVWRERKEGQPFFGQVTLWAGKNPTRVAPPVDRDAVAVMPYYPDTPEFRERIATHYDQIRTTDHEVGEIMTALREDRLLENTWVVFLSDHGYDLLRHKQFCYDGGTHVPLIVRPPDELDFPGRGTRREDLTTTLDVTATTLTAAGMPVPDWMDSRNLFDPGYRREYIVSSRDRCDATIDHIRSVRTGCYRYIRNFLTDRPLMQPQYRSGTEVFQQYRALWKEGKLPPEAVPFAGDERPAEELYDHERDAHEVVNLAENPEYADILAEHRGILDRWIAETGDRGGQTESREQYRWLRGTWGPDQCWAPEYQGLDG